MKKVFLGVGHGGNDPGAVGYLREEDINLTMAQACADYLRSNGVEVKMSRTRDENDPLAEEIRECNAYNPDVAVDVHNNAGGGNGFEVLHYHRGGTSKELAANIEAEVKKIGQNSRGLKTRLNSAGNDYFGFIRCINAPSIIVEGVFVDNAADAAQADTLAEQRKFGVAYAKGILKTLGVEDKGGSGAQEEKPQQPQKEMYRVRKTWADVASQKGAFEVLKYAKSCADKYGCIVFNSKGEAVYKAGSTHEVERGDTLGAIAKKYGSTVDGIVKANKKKYPKITANHIEVGWKLMV